MAIKTITETKTERVERQIRVSDATGKPIDVPQSATTRVAIEYRDAYRNKNGAVLLDYMPEEMEAFREGIERLKREIRERFSTEGSAE